MLGAKVPNIEFPEDSFVQRAKQKFGQHLPLEPVSMLDQDTPTDALWLASQRYLKAVNAGKPDKEAFEQACDFISASIHERFRQTHTAKTDLQEQGFIPMKSIEKEYREEELRFKERRRERLEEHKEREERAQDGGRKDDLLYTAVHGYTHDYTEEEMQHFASKLFPGKEYSEVSAELHEYLQALQHSGKLREWLQELEPDEG